jgi:hypothetical protein
VPSAVIASRTDHLVLFQSRGDKRQIYQDREHDLRSLAEVMQAAKQHCIPFVRKVDVKVQREAQALLHELQQHYWGQQQQMKARKKQRVAGQ